jgi:hypothetical protein
MAEEKKYNKHPKALPDKGDRTVTFYNTSYPDDPSQNIEVLSTLPAGDLKRLEKLGYRKVAGAKPKGPSDNVELSTEPKKATPPKAKAPAS